MGREMDVGAAGGAGGAQWDRTGRAVYARRERRCAQGARSAGNQRAMGVPWSVSVRRGREGGGDGV